MREWTDDPAGADTASSMGLRRPDELVRWLCAQAHGREVLTAGSQVAQLSEQLAREGFRVIGLAAPSADDQVVPCEPADSFDGRLKIISASMWDWPVPDASVDSIVLQDPFAKVAAPDRVLQEVARTLRRGGRLVLASSILDPTDPTKEPFGPLRVLRVVIDHLRVDSVDVVNGSVRILAEKGTEPGDLDAAQRLLVEPLVRSFVELHVDVDRAHQRIEAADARSREDARRIQELEARSERAGAALVSAQESRAAAMRARSVGDERSRARIEKLERDRAALRYQLDLARWKLDSLRARRWWRVGQVLAGVRRSPSRLLVLPIRLTRAAMMTTEARPRPQAPSEHPSNVSALSLEDQARELIETEAGATVPRRLVPVATILAADEAMRFEHEWHNIGLAGRDWPEVLEEDRPELLFVSSAGLSSDTFWSLSDAGGAREVSALVEACRSFGVPTAFWDSSTTGIVARVTAEVGRLFDVVFCATESGRAMYQEALQHDRIYLLAPSTQPRFANPTSIGQRRGVLIVRSEGEPVADGPAREAAKDLGGYEVMCVDRGSGPTLRDEPGVIQSHVLPSLAKRFAVVVPPPMGSENLSPPPLLLDLAASNTPIVMDVPATGSEMLGPSVVQASTFTDATDAIKSLQRSDDLRARVAQQARRAVLRDHTMARRVDEVLSRTGFEHHPPPPTLTMMIPTNRPENLRNIMENLGRQDYPNIDAVLVLHGIDLDEGLIRDEAARSGVDRLEVLHVDGSVVLGEVFNRGFAASSGAFVGKMDDDDFYGAAYASDLMACFEYSEADIVGKWTHFAYIEKLSATVLRYPGHEHSYQEILAISTLIMKREVLDVARFPAMPSGSGSVFLREAASEGVRAYAGDRFNYLYVRSSDNGRHTWSFSDFEMAARSVRVCVGRNLDHVIA